MANQKQPNKTFMYLGILLVVIGIVMLVAGTQTITYQHEVFTVNGMNLGSAASTPNYFINFLGLAILLFGVGSLLAQVELNRKGVKG